MGQTWPLDEDEIEQYHREGWLVVEGVLDAETLAEIDSALTEVCEAALADEETKNYIEFEPADSTERPSVRRVIDPYARHEAFRAVAHDVRVVDRVESLLGPDIDLQHSKLNWKPARVGSPVGWHQDLGYYPHTNDGVLAVLIYLDGRRRGERMCAGDASSASSLPRSHRAWWKFRRSDRRSRNCGNGSTTAACSRRKCHLHTLV